MWLRYAGTMWMVGIFFMFGMRGMWVHLYWCFPLAGFVMAYKAKWAYRSGVLTGMEWLIFRFGNGSSGKAARLTLVTITLAGIILMLGYAGVGVGKFAEEILGVPKDVAVPLLFVITGILGNSKAW